MNRAKIFIAFTFLLAIAVCISAQSVQFPNELKGYEFFGNGKLEGLKLGFSTKEDVVKIFGENCSDECDYNQKWIIMFTYFDGMTKGGWRGEKTYTPLPKYLGKIYSISLRHKLKTSFKKSGFLSKFRYNTGGSKNVYGYNGETIYYFAYTDKYGLGIAFSIKKDPQDIKIYPNGKWEIYFPSNTKSLTN